ncbi:hypothetical protein MGG_18000 [Pyricularia oryzae 70-15]|uniref:Uncharacterized protein n=3 Tax=Pyricularia oryzae TaxID=318829 RepID=G5EHM2_PYRO7|nr:uncharacterized protein MGG_18000 [Pyricularia oryzae 70-15]EAQ70992.1 hypothetical protein MGCH7_ch7g399 [Pyricularia oryzae 70-15]EHA46365.1 hypothetical protein MGG_18000 [Pyricularia oryzae 70-15]ELQ36275.1 hypothetical protein OOU_Y34scaffold00666g136 [Pyricularia oryzae Y34]
MSETGTVGQVLLGLKVKGQTWYDANYKNSKPASGKGKGNHNGPPPSAPSCPPFADSALTLDST